MHSACQHAPTYDYLQRKKRAEADTYLVCGHGTREGMHVCRTNEHMNEEDGIALYEEDECPSSPRHIQCT